MKFSTMNIKFQLYVLRKITDTACSVNLQNDSDDSSCSSEEAEEVAEDDGKLTGIEA
jgi:hypothetical protein